MSSLVALTGCPFHCYLCSTQLAEAEQVLESASALVRQPTSCAPLPTHLARQLQLQPTLMRVQLALDAGLLSKALELLASVSDPALTTCGSLVATRLSLHEQVHVCMHVCVSVCMHERVNEYAFVGVLACVLACVHVYMCVR